ncbi:response regulator [Rickettsiales bacterium]|nr:response regulator [Rickettsiales bacterium]
MAKCILTVDDSKTMRNMVSEALKNAGYDVLEAEDGQEALSVIEKNNIDMIITDINMPNMDGIEFITKLRSIDNHKSTPIIALTTEGGDSMKERGKAAGANGWMVKPFNPEKMLMIVNRLCA